MDDITGIENLRKEFKQARAELDAYLDTLPHHPAAMPEPYTHGLGHQVDARRGWTQEEQAEVTRLRDRERELAVRLTRARAGKTGPGAGCA
jgi:CHASE3 domain sensor protein